jgi:hypothetical protein
MIFDASLIAFTIQILSFSFSSSPPSPCSRPPGQWSAEPIALATPGGRYSRVAASWTIRSEEDDWPLYRPECRMSTP